MNIISSYFQVDVECWCFRNFFLFHWKSSILQNFTKFCYHSLFSSNPSSHFIRISSHAYCLMYWTWKLIKIATSELCSECRDTSSQRIQCKRMKIHFQQMLSMAHKRNGMLSADVERCGIAWTLRLVRYLPVTKLFFYETFCTRSSPSHEILYHSLHFSNFFPPFAVVFIVISDFIFLSSFVLSSHVLQIFQINIWNVSKCKKSTFPMFHGSGWQWQNCCIRSRKSRVRI